MNKLPIHTLRPLVFPRAQDGITPGRFNHFLANAPPGDAYIYHVGFLLQDRGVGGGEHPGALPHKMGDIAWKSYKLGETVLLQKRLKEGQFVYLAVKRGGGR